MYLAWILRLKLTTVIVTVYRNYFVFASGELRKGNKRYNYK